MTYLRIPLCGPMMSWSDDLLIENRSTRHIPTHSALLGLVGAALGVPRHELRSLADLEFYARTDKGGSVLVDFQTVQNPHNETGKSKSLVTKRAYLCDAKFTVAVVADRARLERIHDALREPVYPLYLGKSNCPPTVPLWQPDGLTEEILPDDFERIPHNRGWME